MSETMKFPAWSIQTKCPFCLFPMHYTRDMQNVHCNNRNCQHFGIEYEAPTVELRRVSPA